MTAPDDEDPAIASLLGDAARLAEGVNEKLDEALAIAKRDVAFNADRQWFKSRPDRSFRARLATAQEIADLRDRTEDGAVSMGPSYSGLPLRPSYLAKPGLRGDAAPDISLYASSP